MSKFGEAMRGLTVFISDIRGCKSREAERKRINKELANIRSKFKGDRLDGYNKKKYVCKLVFIFLLGNDVDFGHQEAVNLLSSVRFSEKQIGYLFVSVLIGEGHDLMQLVVQAIRHDLESRNPIFNTLAMQCIANIAFKEMAETLGKDIPPLLTSADSSSAVKQTAALCLLRLLRVHPSAIPIDQYAARIVQLLNDRHLGVVTASCSLLEEFARINSLGFSECVNAAVIRLSRIVTASHSDLQDYTYYFVPAPWLTVKLMRLLQCFTIPDDAVVRARLSEALEAVLNRAQEPSKSKKVQHSNAKNAVLFEAINLIVHFQGDPSLQVRACNLLGTYLTHKETNMRYLSLEALSHLATSELSREAVKKHQELVLKALKTERDISVRQRAIDLLYAMCDHSNAETIVGELLGYLEKADYSVRETLVLKIAILSEKYAQDYSWYVDTILNLIRLAGDYVSEDVWYRIIQIVINRQDVQGYAAKTCFEALQAPACHENMVKVGGYILGEFGNLIAGDPRSSPMVQFQLLHSKFHLCSANTRALLLSTYIKFINLFPEIKPTIQQVLQADTQARNSNQEIQQRASEYLKLSSVASTDVLATVLEEMPPFPERESSLLSKLYQTAPWTAKLHHDEGEEGAPKPPAGGMAPIQAPEAPVANGPLVGIQPPLVTTGSPSQPPQPSLQQPPPAQSADLLVDVFSTPTAPPPGPAPGPAPAAVTSLTSPAGPKSSLPPTPSPGTEEGLLFKGNGVLFENDTLQIGVKAEYKKNLGRVGVFYGNKSNSPLLNFSSDVVLSDDLRDSLNVQMKSIGPSIDAGAQVQQVVNIECKSVFFQPPLLNIMFSVGGAPQQLTLKLPVLLSKFFEPTAMNSQEFFQRWKQLGGPNQEAQKIFAAKFPIEKETASNKLMGFGVSILEGVDPNPDNFVSAGVINTRAVLVGCLLRLEPNLQTKMYRLTVRTSHETVSAKLCELLSEQF